MANEMNTHNLHSTDIDRRQESKDDLEFTAYFWKNLFIAIAIGFLGTIGLIVAVVNADRIDAFFSEVLKAIFGI